MADLVVYAVIAPDERGDTSIASLHQDELEAYDEAAATRGEVRPMKVLPRVAGWRRIFREGAKE